MAASRTDLPVHAPGTCGPSSPGAARSHRPLAPPTRLRSESCNKANQQRTLLGSDSPSKKIFWPSHVDERKISGSSRGEGLSTKISCCSSLVIYAARAHKEGPNALPAGVQRRGSRGLRPHGGDDHVAFAAHHRRHTARLSCALRLQCPISRSHLSTTHPSAPQIPVPPKGTSPPRLADPTSSPLFPPPTNATSFSRQLS